MRIRPEVMAFAKAMEKQLRENEWKGGWHTEREDFLYKRIIMELAEMTGCLLTKNYSDLLGEAADVANFIMMICDNHGVLKHRSPRREDVSNGGNQ